MFWIQGVLGLWSFVLLLWKKNDDSTCVTTYLGPFWVWERRLGWISHFWHFAYIVRFAGQLTLLRVSKINILWRKKRRPREGKLATVTQLVSGGFDIESNPCYSSCKTPLGGERQGYLVAGFCFVNTVNPALHTFTVEHVRTYWHFQSGVPLKMFQSNNSCL